MEQPGFFKQVSRTFTLKRTPLQWAAFVLLFALVWLFAVGLIIAGSFWIPQTRTGWILLIVLGPPAWMLVEFLMYLFRKTRFYQVVAATIRDMPSYARVFFGVVIALGLLLSGYAVLSACAWVVSEL